MNESSTGYTMGKTEKLPMDDELDGVLFRFWIRAATFPGGWPGDLIKALTNCHTPDEYREALIRLADQKGVNLPMPGRL